MEYRIITIRKGEHRLPAGHTGNYDPKQWIAKEDCWQLVSLSERGQAIDQETFYDYDKLQEVLNGLRV